MEKCIFIGRFLELLLLTLISVDKVAMEEIKVTVSWSSNKTTAFLGKAQYYDNKGTAQFFGIRYGQPPVGDGRFQKSALYEYDNETVVAEEHGNICPQRRKNNGLINDADKMGEDCLFLNIIVPLDDEPQDVLKNANKKAVYIFFHGGVFVRGSSNLYVTSNLVMHGDFIAVTLNYRLGIFGFLTTDDDVMPANLGLWDQQLAIKWVKENIETFGGDSSRITVGGQSAGSMSAILQSFYDGNRDLFQNTIAESGSPFAVKIIAEKGLPAALEVAEMAGCGLSSSKGDKLSNELLKCLREKTVTELADLKDTETPLGPVLDNDFIAKETFELCPQSLERFSVPKSISSNFANKNLLTGFTSDDGEILLSLILGKLMDVFLISNKAAFLQKPIGRGILRSMLGDYFLANKTEDALTKQVTVDAVMQHYTDWSDPGDKIATSMSAIHIMTDYFFIYPGIKTALLHSIANTCDRLKASNCGKNKASTYLYEFRYPPSSLLAVTGDFPWFHGSRHGAELFLFADTGLRKNLPNLTETLYTTWSNFINTGNPNSANSNDWKEFSEKSQDMYLLSNESKLVRGTHANSVHFWEDYLPKLQDNMRDVVGRKTKCEGNTAKSKNDNDNNSGVSVRPNVGKHLVFFIFSTFIVATLKM